MSVSKELRHEYKYYISPYEYQVVAQRLRPIMLRDPNVDKDGNYHIRSLYFDDVYDSALIQKNAGSAEREKFRIRIYNMSDDIIKLERKAKYDNYINKVSASITKSEFYSILNGDLDFLLKKDSPVCKLFYIRAKTNLLKPSVVVDYIREALVYPMGGVRVTFDKRLEAGASNFDIFDQNFLSLSSAIYSDVILEVKYNKFLPGVVKDILKVKSSMTAASKYVICRLALNDYNMKGCL